MSRKENKYGIAKTNILVHDISHQRQSLKQRTVLLGNVVKIENILANGNINVRFLDKTQTHFEDVLYQSKFDDFVSVSERLWPLLIAMPSPMDRVAVAKNGSLCDQIVALQLNDHVEILHNKMFHDAVIKYIGSVEAMGFGHYYGLQLMSRIQITKCDGSYADKQYFTALPGTGMFVSIDKLHPVFAYLSSVMKKPDVINYPSFDSIMHDVELRTDSKTSPMLEQKEIALKNRNSQQHRVSVRSENEMDLIELIGGSWPGVTDTANIVDIPTRSIRNKSLNPVSHLINARKSVRIQPKNELVVNVGTNIPNFTSASSALNSHIEDTNQEVIETESHQPAYDVPPTSASGTGHHHHHLTVGTLVEVITDISDPLYGVIRWIGDDGLAGIELEEDHEHLLDTLDLTDGVYNNQRYFSCAGGRGLFVPVTQCQRDSRFDDAPAQAPVNQSKMFGQLDSPIVPGSVAPLSMPTEEDVLAVCGKYKGIQGHHNSCYLDATLFAMFTYTDVFDSLLFRPRASNDIARYEEVQRVLREEIVNPLRQNLYVRADRVMKLRMLLEDLSSVSGLTSEEKDPEEFLNSLLAQILKAEPFLKLSSGQEAFYYQLFVEKDEGLALPSVQQLFEQSFLSSDIKLKEVPSCLIIQMPRFGKNFKMYPRILPSQLLDVTDIIENSPRQCTVCGKLAQYECKECFGQCGMGLESTAFCAACLETAHMHVKRTSHSPRLLTVPHDFAIMAEHCPPPRLYMELFAVVCIETSHYVAFVKCGSGHEAPWCFFDSMADRKGEQNGYNIPEMVACPDVSNWLSDDGAVSRLLHEANPHDKQLPEHARRLLCDAYICMYQSPDVMMYR